MAQNPKPTFKCCSLPRAGSMTCGVSAFQKVTARHWGLFCKFLSGVTSSASQSSVSKCISSVFRSHRNCDDHPNTSPCPSKVAYVLFEPPSDIECLSIKIVKPSLLFSILIGIFKFIASSLGAEFKCRFLGHHEVCSPDKMISHSNQCSNQFENRIRTHFQHQA
jgi:hypothetical protein